jgi:hypothetical protein
MGTPRAMVVPGAVSHSFVWLGVILLILGLLGHLLAARAIGGSHLAYKDHIQGFVLLTAVSGAIITGLGLRFWKGRYDISVLILGALQALLGVAVYVERFHV